MKDLNKLKEIIWKAVPEICRQKHTTCNCTQLTGSKYYCRKIGIADVMVASKKMLELYTNLGTLYIRKLKYDNKDHKWCQWNPKEDNLDWHAKNKPETIKFLLDLLK